MMNETVTHYTAAIPTTIMRINDSTWRVANDGLGVYAYGSSIDEATHKMIENLNAVADYFFKVDRADALEERFNQAGIAIEKQVVVEEMEPAHTQTKDITMALVLSLAFGKVREAYG